MKIERKPRNDKQFYLLQSQAVIDAVVDWRLKRDDTLIDNDGTDGQHTIGDLYFTNIKMDLDDQVDLDVNGLPKDSISGKTMDYLMPRDIELNVRMLTDGRAVINKDAIHPWWHIMKRPRSKGGLRISDGLGGFRDVALDGSDIVPLAGSFYNAVIAMLVPDVIE
jgi:hypothetical protein